MARLILIQPQPSTGPNIQHVSASCRNLSIDTYMLIYTNDGVCVVLCMLCVEVLWRENGALSGGGVD